MELVVLGGVGGLGGVGEWADGRSVACGMSHAAHLELRLELFNLIDAIVASLRQWELVSR